MQNSEKISKAEIVFLFKFSSKCRLCFSNYNKTTFYIRVLSRHCFCLYLDGLPLFFLALYTPPHSQFN